MNIMRILIPCLTLVYCTSYADITKTTNVLSPSNSTEAASIEIYLHSYEGNNYLMTYTASFKTVNSPDGADGSLTAQADWGKIVKLKFFYLFPKKNKSYKKMHGTMTVTASKHETTSSTSSNQQDPQCTYKFDIIPHYNNNFNYTGYTLKNITKPESKNIFCRYYLVNHDTSFHVRVGN